MGSMDGRDGIVEPVEEALSTIRAGRILDVATGSAGFITFLLDNIRDFSEIIGIDLNQRPLETARNAFLRDNIRFLRMDASHMEFPADYFDTVCISNSLHHIDDLSGVLSEMTRVCKPGGQIIICEMYRDGQKETQQTHVDLHHWWAAVDTAEGILHHETYTRQDIVAITQGLGLQSLKYFDLKDLETDPKDPELIRELDGIIENYQLRAKALERGIELQLRGETLHQRLHQVGFHSATSLFVIGKK
jgi:SAM-dependent methyltransferase